MPALDRTRSALDSALLLAFGLLLLLFPLLYGWLPVDLGGDTTVSQSLAVTLFEAGAGLLALLAGLRCALGLDPSAPRRGRSRLLVALGLAFLGLGLVQFLPLPPQLHAFLSPRGSALVDRFHDCQWNEPRTLSLLPRHSFWAFLKIAACFAVFLAARALPRSRREIHLFFAAAALMGGLVAFLGLVKSFAPDALSFLFPQGGAGHRAAGPFLNPNHFAGYLSLCFPPALAAFVLAGPFPALEGFDRASLGAFLRRDGGKKALAGFACLLMAAAVVASLSRLGIFSFLLGLCVFFFLLYRGRRRRFAFGLVLFASFAALFAASVYVGLDPVLERYSLLEDAGVNRLDAWKMGLAIAADFPLTGSGMGTFRFLSPLYQPASLAGAFHQTHNDYINLAADMGLPALLAALAFLAVWARSLLRTARSPGLFRPTAAAAFLASASALAVHSLGDFNLQVASNGMLFALVLGLGAALHRLSSREPTFGDTHAPPA